MVNQRRKNSVEKKEKLSVIRRKVHVLKIFRVSFDGRLVCMCVCVCVNNLIPVTVYSPRKAKKNSC